MDHIRTAYHVGRPHHSDPDMTGLKTQTEERVITGQHVASTGLKFKAVIFCPPRDLIR